MVEAETRAVDQFAGVQADRAVPLSDQSVGGNAVQMDRRQERFEWRPALREQRRDETGQDIATAGGGQARIAAGIDEPATVGCRDHRAASLERHQRLVARGNFERRRESIRLDGCRVAASSLAASAG